MSETTANDARGGDCRRADTDGPRPAPGAERPQGDPLREMLERHEARLRELVIAHPVPVLLGALAAGYLLARLMRSDES